MQDLAAGGLSVAEAQAQANLAGKLVRWVELRLRYGQMDALLGARDVKLFEEIGKLAGVPVPPPDPAGNGQK